MESERTELDGLWQKRMERASYEAERAGRHYQLLEPENRLVARQLAREWEHKLAAQQELEEDYRRFATEKPRFLSEHERESIRRLAQGIPALWRAETTTNAERKEIIRQVVERVVVEAEGKSERVGVRVGWAGGRQTTATMIRPVAGFKRLSYYPQLCERVRQLAQQELSSREIARRLDEEGYRSPKLVKGFGEQGVKEIVRRLGLSRPKGPRKRITRPPESNGLLGEHEWWLASLAREIQVPETTLYAWVRRGWARARQLQDHPQRRWVVWADWAELERLRRLHELPTGYHTRSKWIEPEGDDERVPR